MLFRSTTPTATLPNTPAQHSSLPPFLPPSLPPASHRTPVPRRHLPVAPGTDTRRRPGTRNPSFSSPRSPSLRNDRPSTCRVAPFGNPGIKGHLHLPRAYRSLSRPSSPPRAKASTVCPCLLSLSLALSTRYPREDRAGLIFLQLALCFFVTLLFEVVQYVKDLSRPLRDHSGE